MNKFWKIRIFSILWGVGVAYFFTHRIDLTGKISITQIIGNTIILWWFMREKK